MTPLDSIAERDVQAEEIEAHLRYQNEKLVNALYEAREQITSLKEEVDKLCAPPSTYGVYLSVNEDGTINVLSQGRQERVPAGEADQERGRGSGPGGSAGHQLRGHRRPHHPDRGDQGRRGAALPLRRLLPRASADAAQGRPALRSPRLRQDHDRQGGGQQSRPEDLRQAVREAQGLLPQHQAPGAPQQVRGRDGTQDPRDLREGAREGRRRRPSHP